MTERIDHAAEAVSDIRYADEVLADGGDSDVAKAIAAVAQVHATLALVEQHRIANLIALAGLSAPNGFEDETYDTRTAALMEGLLDSETVAAVPGYGPAGIDERVFIRPEIREGLGL